MMYERIVEPYESRREALGVLLTASIVLVVSALLIAPKQLTGAARSMLPYQLDALSMLSDIEQAIFVELRTAGEEIWLYHRMEGEKWPDAEELAADGISPFASDSLVDSQALHRWRYTNMDVPNRHAAAYIGTPEEHADVGQFVLLIEHKLSPQNVDDLADDHEISHIWYDRSKKRSLPERFDESSFVRRGWKEIVAYEGADEVSRIRGDQQ